MRIELLASIDMNKISSLPNIDDIIYSSSQPVVTIFVPEMWKLLAKLFEGVNYDFNTPSSHIPISY